MSGRKINDRSNWMGAPSKESPLPMNCKMKQETSAASFGALGTYEDDTDAIKRQQNMNTSKVHGHPQKPGHRN